MLISFIGSISISEAQVAATLTLSTPDEFLQMLRDRQKPVLITKFYLTDNLAEQIIGVQVWAAPLLRKINEDYHSNKSITLDEEVRLVKELNNEKEKRYTAILQNEMLSKKISDFYADMIKNRTWPDGIGKM